DVRREIRRGHSRGQACARPRSTVLASQQCARWQIACSGSSRRGVGASAENLRDGSALCASSPNSRLGLLESGEAERSYSGVSTSATTLRKHRYGLHSGPRLRLCGRRQERRSAEDPRDRKSTRLNSSHVEISYAVFCLK